MENQPETENPEWTKKKRKKEDRTVGGTLVSLDDQGGWGWKSKWSKRRTQVERRAMSDQHGGKARRSGSSVNWTQFADESLGVAWSE
jgi:hypothetical protein